jgi:hypothetical protein
MEDPSESSITKRAADLPVSAKSSVSGGLVHHINSTTASVKLTGNYLRNLSDTGSDLTSSEDEERDYTITEIDLNRKVGPLSGLEDTEPLGDKGDRASVTATSSSSKEQLNPSSQRSDKTAEGSPQNSNLKKIFSEVRFNPFDRDLHMEEDHYTEVVKADMSEQDRCKSSNGRFTENRTEASPVMVGLLRVKSAHQIGV